MQIRISFISVFIWLVIGLIISIPYNWLVDGDHESFSNLLVFSPGVVLLLSLFFLLGWKNCVRELRKTWLTVFGAGIVIFLMPIILRFVSMGLKALELNSISEFVFRYRFAGIPACFILMVIIAVSIKPSK
jgi:hypothetical protein